ncbi:recombination regulator RecX, partial [Pasteurella multocida subsp. multocida str. Anand1_cattle]
ITDLKLKQKVWRYMLSHGFKPEQFAHYVGHTEYEE